MATIGTVIQNAYRKAGIIPLGATVSAPQSAVGQSLLTETYYDLVIKGTLGVLCDVYTTSAMEAKENTRVFAASPLVITYPVTVVDDTTGLTRAPLDGAVIQVVGTGRTPATVIYDALTAAWQDITVQTLTAEAPLSISYGSDLEALLAGKLADERGIPIGPVLSSQIKAARYHLSRRNNTASPVAQGSYF